jgi:fatty acid desaturase
VTDQLPVPGRLNLLILTAAVVASTGLLWGASHANHWWVLVVVALMFSLTANTLFSLMHEAVHGVLHNDRRVNEWGGRLASAFFPTSLSLQRGFHLVHHRNNRTELEQFDYLRPGDIRWLKYAQWYAILTGVYWAVAVVGVLVYLLLPGGFRIPSLRNRDEAAARQTSSAAYLAVVDSLPPVATRLEIVLSLSIQLAIFWLFDLSVVGWVACYSAFAVQWSGLQYADHAFSPLDVRNGAWNLRVNPLWRAMFLNYHDHLAHHQHPKASWIHLPSLVAADQPRPSYLSVWLSMWAGPRPLP